MTVAQPRLAPGNRTEISWFLGMSAAIRSGFLAQRAIDRNRILTHNKFFLNLQHPSRLCPRVKHTHKIQRCLREKRGPLT